MNRQTARLWVLPLSFLLLAGCGGEKEVGHESGDSHEEETHAGRVVLKPASIREIGLVLVTAQEKEITGSITAPAVLTADQDLEAVVGTLVPGRVSKVFVRLGDRVRKGQPLMQIEGMEIGEIKARYIQAKAQLNFATTTLERQRVLAGEKIGSQKSLQEAQAGYDQALAGFQAEDKRIHSIGLTDAEVLDSGEGSGGMDHTAGILVIPSPVDGTVVERNVVIGQLVDESATAFRVINHALLWADGRVFEKDLAHLSGKPEITLKATAWPGELFRGRISYVGEIVDGPTHSVQVRAEIKNPDRRLKSGMFGEMTIPIHAAQSGLAVPAEALVREEGRTFLFVAIDDTTFALREVEAGIISGEEVEIRSGLQAGERVAGKGVFYLRSEWKKGEFAEDEH